MNLYKLCILSNFMTYIFKGGDFLFNPLTVNLFNLNFHPLEVVSR